MAKLRQIDVLLSQGKTVPLACKEAGIVELAVLQLPSSRRYAHLAGNTGAGSVFVGAFFEVSFSPRRATAAFWAIAERRPGVSFSMRAGAPFFPPWNPS